MAEPVHEVHEHAKKAREDSSLVGATFTMAVMAVLVAAISVLGHRAHSRTLLDQTKAADAWAEYQARSIRRHNYELFIDLFSVVPLKDPAQAEKIKEHYTSEIQRYEQSLGKTRKSAEDFETEGERNERKGARYDLGEVCLEAALVITSITLITRKRPFWGIGSALAIAGIVIAASGAWVH